MTEHLQDDPAALHAAPGFLGLKSIKSDYSFSNEEIETLRALASRVAEIAAMPVMSDKAKLWTAHNDLKTDEPLVLADPENGWNEIIPPASLVSKDPLARFWEMSFRKQIFWAEEMKDDKIIEPYFDVPYIYDDDGWGVELEKHGGDDLGAYIIDPAIKDYESDLPKIHYPNISVDDKGSDEIMEFAEKLFGGILQTRRKNAWWWSFGMCYDFVHIRGLENFMCDLIAEPDNFHRMMKLLCDGKLQMLDFLEEKGLLTLNNEGTYIGSGGLGYTDELPRPGFDGTVTAMDMWGFVESQETVSISPKQYAEFVLPYHLKIMDRFGLNIYGCCEIFDTRWEYVKRIPRLRRVSCSAWSDWSKVPEYLGKNYVASVKPSPATLALGNMNEDVVRADCRNAAERTKGGICEFLMKDNHTLGGNPGNIVRWVEIMREEIARVY